MPQITGHTEHLQPGDEQILQEIFEAYDAVRIEDPEQPLTGATDTRLLVVTPRQDGNDRLPHVVKIGPDWLIEQEWQAYQEHIKDSLPEDIPPLGKPKGNAASKGLAYPLAGQGVAGYEQLLAYFQGELSQAPESNALVEALEEVFKPLNELWRKSRTQEYTFRAGYDEVLPVNLTVQFQPPPPAVEPKPLTPEHVISPKIFGNGQTIGDFVRLDGFLVSEIEPMAGRPGQPQRYQVTLNHPDKSDPAAYPSYRLRLQGLATVDGYDVGAMMPDPVVGQICQTRPEQLAAVSREIMRGWMAVDLTAGILSFDDQPLPNPLTRWPALLTDKRSVNVSPIHGDLHLGNVLIRPKAGWKSIRFIDFGRARRDHVLHDFLRLETDLLTRLLPAALEADRLPVPELLHRLRFLWFEPLHRAGQLDDDAQAVTPTLLPPAARRCYALVRTVRRQARRFLTAPQDWAEYHQGLTLYLLGALKFKLSLPARRIAFLGAALALDLYDKPDTRPRPLSPYKGLLSFTAEDSRFFFGRDKTIQQLAEHVEANSFVAVIGPSGSGKSSLVQAGLLPHLRKTGAWLAVTARPQDSPFYELAVALLVQIGGHSDHTSTEHRRQVHLLASRLEQGTLGLSQLINRLLPGHGRQQRVILIIDQFEELFTLCPTPEARRRFMELLLTGLNQQTFMFNLLLTLRADFMEKAMELRLLTRLLKRRGATFLVEPMGRAELKQAISGPAACWGHAFAPALVERILDDAYQQQESSLPLLEVVLEKLWFQPDANRFYQESGGIGGAITRYADGVISKLPAGDQDLARRLLLQLVKPGEGTKDTKRVTRFDELWPGSDRLIPKLATARLVLTSRKDQAATTVELVHEALIQDWATLRQWLEESREFRRWQERLRSDLHRWQETGEDEGALLRGAPLAEAEGWLARQREDMGASEKEFIQRSIALRERQNREREARRQRELEAAQKLAHTEQERAAAQATAARRLRTGLIVSLLITLVAIAAAATAWLFFEQAHQAQEETLKTAELARARALAAFALAETAQPQDTSGSLALLLAMETVNIYQDPAVNPGGLVAPEVDAALRQAVDAAPSWRMTLPRHRHTADVNAAAFSPDGQTLVTASSDQTARLWDVETGEQRGRFDHPAPVTSAEFSPDGQTLVTTSWDNTARLWDVETGRELQQLRGHTAGVTAANFSPTGEMIVTASADHTVRLWDAETGQERRRLRDHTERVSSVAFSPDGELIVTASWDHTVRLWEVATGQERRRFILPALVFAAAFSPDGQTLVTTSRDGAARLWDVETGEQRSRFDGHTAAVFSAAFSPDGQSLVTASGDKTARLWDVDTGRERRQFSGHIGSVFAAFSPDGQTLVTASDDNTARLWDVDTGRELRLFSGHTNSVLSAAFSPDGQTLVTASDDNTARLWDVASGRERHTLRGHTDWVWSAAFSPDGQTLVTASADNTARLWDVASGRERHTLRGHTEWVDAAAFSPDGQTLVTASADNTARLWDVETGQERHTLRGHTGWVNAAAFSPDGQTLVTASWDKTARLWDVDTGRERHTLRGHTDWVNAAAFSPDGQSLVTASNDNTARLWDVDTGRELRLFSGHTNSVLSAAFSPDGQTLVTASGDKTARLWDVDTGRERHTLRGHTSSVNAAAFSPDGQSIVTASGDKTARLWDMDTGRERRLFSGHTEWVNAAAFSPDGQSLVTASGDKTARLWDVASGRERRTLRGHTADVNAAAFSPDGQSLVTASGDKTARLWDVASGRERRTLRGHTEWVNAAAFSPDGQSLVTASGDKTARLWDVATGRERHTLRGHTDWVWSAAFSPDGQTLVTASADNTARLWDVATGRERHTLRGHTDWVWSAAFSPDGQTLVTASWDKTARLWDVETGQERHTLRGHTDWVNAAAFSPDGQTLVTASGDKTARLWDVATGRERHTLRGHTEWVNAAAFSPDGQSLVTASGDKTARLWDVATGRERHTLRGHTSSVNAAAFSPDGQSIVTASDDNTARLWDVDTGWERHTLRGHTDWVNAAAFSPDGQSLVTASNDNTARLWLVSIDDLMKLAESLIQRDPPIFTLAERRQYELAPIEPAWAIPAFGSAGFFLNTAPGRVMAGGGLALLLVLLYLLRRYLVWPVIILIGGGSLLLLGVAGYSAFIEGNFLVWLFWTTLSLGGWFGIVFGVAWLIGYWRFRRPVSTAAFSPDGRLIVTAHVWDKVARLWETDTGREVHCLRGHKGWVFSAFFSPDGKWVVTSSADKTARLWDVDTGRELRLFSGHTAGVIIAVFSPDSRLIATASQDGTTRLWGVDSGEQCHVFEGHEGAVYWVAFSPDGQRIATASADETVRLWDISNGQEVRLFKGHTGPVYCVAFSPDGQWIVTCGQDKTARLWETATGRQVRSFEGHTAPIAEAEFSPDGQTIVTASEDGTTRLWDVTTGRELRRFQGHSGWVNDAAFNPDGQTIVTAGSDGTARLWDVTTGQELRRFSRVRPFFNWPWFGKKQETPTPERSQP